MTITIRDGLAWTADPASGPTWVRTLTPGEAAAEIARLQAEVANLKPAADRWRALMSSPRIRMMGWAGFGRPEVQQPPDANGYRHFGAEFWTRTIDPHHTDAPNNIRSRTILEQYVVAMMGINQPSTIPADGG